MNIEVCQKHCGMKTMKVFSMHKSWDRFSTLVGFTLSSDDGKRHCAFDVHGYVFAENLVSEIQGMIDRGEVEKDGSSPSSMQPSFKTDRQFPLFGKIDIGRMFVFQTDYDADTYSVCSECKYRELHGKKDS